MWTILMWYLFQLPITSHVSKRDSKKIFRPSVIGEKKCGESASLLIHFIFFTTFLYLFFDDKINLIVPENY